jgi:pimeloyl-ACP methyl ester carboxylesterase
MTDDAVAVLDALGWDAAISGARLVIVPGVGHYLPAAVYPQVADEVRALADRAATAAPKPG